MRGEGLAVVVGEPDQGVLPTGFGRFEGSTERAVQSDGVHRKI